MAGRSIDKLEKTKQALAEVGCKGQENIPVVLADSADRSSLDAMAAQAKVVITTVGPYSLYGTPLVESCINNGTNYCDLTGEVPWVRRNMMRLHEQAKENNVKIVHCCGFDSVPFDLGVHMLAKSQEELGREIRQVETLMGPAKGGVSGGTIASGFAILEQFPLKELSTMADPYSLVPVDARPMGTDKDERWGWRFSKMANKWTFPFIMAGANTRVVRRSNALLGNSYGSGFGYTEESAAPNLVVAVLGSMAISLGKLMFIIPPLRWLLKKLLPKPGEGPSRDLMLNGSWRADVYGEAVPRGGPADATPVPVRARVAGFHDPGYYDTSRMLLECALALATQEKDLEAQGYCKGGILTPASAVGMVAVERLRSAGFTFKVEEDGGR